MFHSLARGWAAKNSLICGETTSCSPVETTSSRASSRVPVAIATAASCWSAM